MNIYVIVFLVFLSGILFLGWLSTRKAKDTVADYYVAGRSMSAFVVAGTYGASFLSAGSFIGTTGFNYAYGWSAIWQLGGTLFALGFVGIILGHKFWRFGYYNDGYTLPDLFSARYSPKWSRGIFACVILILYTFGLAAMYMGFHSVLATVTTLPFEVSVTLGALVIIIFTYMGGSRAVAWTDTAQLIIMIAAVVISIPAILHVSGGFNNLAQAYANTPPAPPETNWMSGEMLIQPVTPFMTIAGSIGWFAIWFFGNISQPHQITRMYLAKDEKNARAAVAMVFIPFVLVFLAGMIIASYARVINPALSNIDMAFPTVIVSVFPPLIAAIILMGLVSAIMSTASTMLIICSMSTSYDIYKCLINPNILEKSLVKISRITTAVIGIISILVAFVAKNIPGLIFLWTAAFSVMGAAIFPSLVAAFYWKRANAAGNIASMVIGAIITLIWFQFPELRPFGLHPILPGVALSTVVLIVVSLLTPKPPKEIIDKFFNEKMLKWL